MPIILKELILKTHLREEIIDITHLVNNAISEEISKLKEGIIRVFVPHTTAGITINENADPDVEKDMISILQSLVPQKKSYKHMEGNSNSHVKASMMGFMQEIIIHNGKMLLGIWQGIKFCEFDGGRNRKVFVQISGE